MIDLDACQIMSLFRRLLAGTLWTFLAGLYQRFVIDVATPLTTRTRQWLIEFSGADSAQPLVVDVALFLFALGSFVWICRALRDNWFFQWLYQVASFGFFGYLALFSWQTMLFLAVLAAETYPEHAASVVQTLFGADS